MSTKFRYVPSPIPFKFACVYMALTNQSGRMQYYKVLPGVKKERISRTEFISAFNSQHILAMRPIPIENNDAVFQLEFYV